MSLYCGIDLHSNNHLLVVSDEKDKRLFEERLPNNLNQTLAALKPYKRRLKGIVVESTFNWYWLVDGLMDAGYKVHLANPAGIQQYSGLKYADDRHDAAWLAHMLRLGILKTGYIYPREQRAIRDMLRRRMQLTQMAARLIIAIQCQVWNISGVRLSAQVIKRKTFECPLSNPHDIAAIQGQLNILRHTRYEITVLEKHILSTISDEPSYTLLKTIRGVGLILGLTILLETGDISRFAKVGNYASYCRCVKSERLSNGKQKGTGNAKNGNKYLSWAFSEAAHFAVQFQPAAKKYLARKTKKTNAMIAIRALAHKLSRAVYYMLRDQVPYDEHKLFG